MKYTCPGCGYKTRHERNFGSYDICSLCGWEDDPVQIANPATQGGANKISLIECQFYFLHKLKKNINTKEQKDPDWRPLNSGEIVTYIEKKMINTRYDEGFSDYDIVYWIKKV